ncbi:tRNA delta(2)-isopentenylpyrophosphate transferase [Neisseria gonorrhoeae]|uniref:tRNA delta(2)-isopentenylpyrophosphate transferase n=1 Tax=Neisseria gonorrhoeae TaxID=485 RepID=A0A378VXK6_NEIGO|nr:tRNA delta(2)-isopentenylpyrophosphate transferase [Neisseria gonorrhoeae]
MLEQGFIGEVENLRRRYPGLTADSPPSAASATVRHGNTSTVQPTDKPSSKKALPPRANLPNAN